MSHINPMLVTLVGILVAGAVGAHALGATELAMVLAGLVGWLIPMPHSVQRKLSTRPPPYMPQTSLPPSPPKYKAPKPPPPPPERGEE